MNNKLYLIIITSFISIGGILGFIPVVMSAMMFDAPDSEKNTKLLVLFYSLISFPPICLVSILIMWVLYYFNKNTMAYMIAGLPLLNICIVLIMIWLISHQ